MSAVEAQAYGVPTIAYDVMGLRDYNEVKQDTNKIALRILDYYHEFSDTQKYMDRRRSLREKTLERFANKTVIPQIKEMMTK
jgi:predicted glycosyltransferase involved in capsule biosynthesis